jgi:hypothetical protein
VYIVRNGGSSIDPGGSYWKNKLEENTGIDHDSYTIELGIARLYSTYSWAIFAWFHPQTNWDTHFCRASRMELPHMPAEPAKNLPELNSFALARPKSRG